MLEIYHTTGTRSFRVIWLCEELSTAYKVIPVDFSAEYRASPEWRQLNPVGKVPVMRDGDLTMFESGAMVQYILDRYGEGRLQPRAGTHEHALYLQWSWFAEATFARPLGEIVNHKRAFANQSSSAAIEEMQGRARLCVDALDDALRDAPYLLGSEFSAADIMMGYGLRGYRRMVTEALPAQVGDYWTRLTQRPAYQAATSADQT